MKIKLVFIVLLYAMNSFAQTEFMPIGSTIFATYRVFRGEGSAVFNPLKDTLCNGEPCRKIKTTKKDKRNNAVYTDYIYFQQKGDSIFEYNEFNKKWSFLFKNRYNIGDSFDIKEVIVNSTYTIATVFIDSVVVSNGIKRYACRIKCLPRSNMDSPFFTGFNLYDKFIVMDFIVKYINPTHFNETRLIAKVLSSLYARIALLTLNALYFFPILSGCAK